MNGKPTRLFCPWDSPGKNTRVGCHFLLQCMKVKSESEVPQSCLTLSDSMDCSFPGSSIHEIFQARVLEWVAIAFSVSAAATCKSLQFCPTLCNPIDGSPAAKGWGKEFWRSAKSWTSWELGIINLKVLFFSSIRYGEGNGNPLQYSCLENPMDGGAWKANSPWGRGGLDTTERLHFHFSLSCIGEGNGNPL